CTWTAATTPPVAGIASPTAPGRPSSHLVGDDGARLERAEHRLDALQPLAQLALGFPDLVAARACLGEHGARLALGVLHELGCLPLRVLLRGARVLEDGVGLVARGLLEHARFLAGRLRCLQDGL